MLSDLNSIIEYIYQENLPGKIVLIGICSGAKLALYYAMKGLHTIEHVIELSTPVLRNDEAMKVEVSRSKSTLSEYINKIVRKETWHKLIKGNIRYKLIYKIISEPIRNILKLAFKGKNRVSSKSKQGSKISNEAFSNFNGSILAIHGEKDPETEVAIKQVKNLAVKYSIPIDSYIIKGANHSFYSISWKNEIFEIIRDWVYLKTSIQSPPTNLNTKHHNPHN